MQICPGCLRENPDDVARCHCGYSFSLEHEQSWRGTFIRLLKPLMWTTIVVGGIGAFVFLKYCFTSAIQHNSTQRAASSSHTWSVQEIDGIRVDVPVRLSPDPALDQLSINPTLASLYSEVSVARAEFGETVITVATMREARSDLASVEEVAEFTAKSFSSQPNVISEIHTIEDWQRGELSGKLLRIQARFQTQHLSVQVLFIKGNSRRWTIHTTYPTSSGSAVADRILASVRSAQ